MTEQNAEHACPKCGHADDDHRRESWYDEEGIEGMTCQDCESPNICRWWTWDWRDVLADEAMWEGAQNDCSGAPDER